jgi:hypothetical protein
MIKSGYIRESVQVIRSHARLLRQFAFDCNNPESKKDYLLQVNHNNATIIKYNTINEKCNFHRKRLTVCSMRPRSL